MQKWARYYSSQGHDILLLSSRLDQLPGVKVVQLHGACFGKMSYVLSIPWAKRVVRSFGPDILHGHYITSYGGMTGRLGLRPFILSAWGSDVLSTLSGKGMGPAFMRWFDAPALRHAAYVTVESPALIETLAKLGVSPERIEVIPWGVDLDVFKPGYLAEATDFRSALSIPFYSKVVLSIRSVKPVYNTLLILSSFIELRHKFPDAVLVLLAGTRDSDYYDEILAFITSEGLAPHVRLIDYALTPRQMATIINMSDAIVSIPQWDSLSVSVLEAAACCRPLVLSHIPANEELVRSGIKADLVDFSTLSISATIERILLGASTSGLEQNRLLIQRKYSWECSAKRMTELYARMINDGGRR